MRDCQGVSPSFRGRANVCFPWPPQDADSHLGGADADDSWGESRFINPGAQDLHWQHSGVDGWENHDQTRVKKKQRGCD